MDKKELFLRALIKEVDESIVNSRCRLKELKKDFLKEEDRLIGFRLSRDNLEEQLRKYVESLPILQEQKNAEVDRIFRSKLEDLLKKI